ncbi:hypothetical protein LINGRAHAP2_LOCUS6204 [Linum grandiflorum]
MDGVWTGERFIEMGLVTYLQLGQTEEPCMLKHEERFAFLIKASGSHVRLPCKEFNEAMRGAEEEYYCFHTSVHLQYTGTLYDI